MDLQRFKKSKMMARALKIGIGSALAIIVAEGLGLEYATSAGSVALLTILTTKWDTVKLAYSRILSFGLTIALAYFFYNVFGMNWLTFGLFLFFDAAALFLIGWDSALSVNALIGIQIIASEDFTWAFLWNEFQIVLIGIVIAILLNLVSDSKRQRRVITEDMRYVESGLQGALNEMADYLVNPEIIHSPAWDHLIEMENYLEGATDRAWHYQNDTFVSHPEYYIQYFEMRTKQTSLLHNMHYQIRIMKQHPEGAQVTADRLRMIAPLIDETTDPSDQIESLQAFYSTIARFPSKRENFQAQATLYHLLINLHEFLVFKVRFIQGLDEQKIRIYVQKDEEKGRPKKLSDIHF